MKISLSTAELLHQLQTASRVASTRSAIQALSGIKIAASTDGVEMLATDMEVGLRLTLTAEVARPGQVVLPARLMLDVARALPGPGVSLELRDAEQDVEIVSGATTFHIRTLRADDFPPLPEAGGEADITVPAAAFVETIAKVARSASRDETRPILTGILVSASASELRMVATDSYRLSVKETVLAAASGAPVRGQRPGPRPSGTRPHRRPDGARRASPSARARTRSSSASTASSSPRG